MNIEFGSSLVGMAGNFYARKGPSSGGRPERTSFSLQHKFSASALHKENYKIAVKQAYLLICMMTTMKIRPLFLLCLLLLGGSLRAGTEKRTFLPDERFLGLSLIQTGGGWPYDPGALWLNAGTSFSLIGYPSFGSRSAPPPLLLSADYSWSPHMAAGAYLGYFRITYSEPGDVARTRFASYQLGGRWLFHGTDYLNDLFGFGLDIRQFDFYTGLSAGLDIRTFSYEQPDKKSFRRDTDGRIIPRIGLIFGFKYIVNQRIGLYAEAGRGSFGAFNFGASFKLLEKRRK